MGNSCNGNISAFRCKTINSKFATESFSIMYVFDGISQRKPHIHTKTTASRNLWLECLFACLLVYQLG